MEKSFVKVRSIKDIAIFVSFLVVGAVLALLPLGMGVNIGGYTLIVVGLVLAFVLKSAFKIEGQDVKYDCKQLTFELDKKSHLLKAVSSKPEIINMSDEGRGLTMRLDVYYSKSENRAYLQLFEYVPHEYNPCSMVYEYELGRVSKLL
jgi:hypothetical protein